jgi:hypothetical protein
MQKMKLNSKCARRKCDGDVFEVFRLSSLLQILLDQVSLMGFRRVEQAGADALRDEDLMF